MNHQRGLPIEAGCLAITVAPNRRPGVTVEVDSFCPPGYHPDPVYGSGWDIYERSWWCIGPDDVGHKAGGKMRAPVPERQLRRIDGPPVDLDAERHEELMELDFSKLEERVLAAGLVPNMGTTTGRRAR